MNDAGHIEAGRSSPGLRYRNVGAAVEWLRRAFGFEILSLVNGEDGSVTYAELSYGNTIIMLGAVQGFDIDSYMAQPEDVGGAETQCCYFVVKDLDTHYARACEAGSEIVLGIKTNDNGDSVYTCRDPEGHLWTFGTYDPWQLHAPAQTAIAPVEQRSYTRALSSFPMRLVAGLSIATIISGVTAMWLYGEFWSTSREATAAPMLVFGPELAHAIKKERRRLWFERTARRAAERASYEAREQADQERTLRLTAEEEARELAQQLALAVQAKETAESAASPAPDPAVEESRRFAQEIQRALAQERTAKEGAQRAAEEAQRTAALAQRTAEEANAELSQVRAAREAAERAAKEAEARVAFVSENAREGAEQAIAEIRKRLEAEQAARIAAEREAEQAREEAARERSSKQAARRTVFQLKKRLAMAQGKPVSSSYSGSAPAKQKAVAQKKPVQAQKAAPEPGADEWSLYSGPAF